ncbi:recombinase family protein [Nonomuraea jabiensis]|uniref:recombinase family protein n=1 Tax=Nonomuraea jabiensis TaxID=882448 RepID=UPI003690C4FA
MSASQGPPGKVGREHTDRMAVVYVRQSTRRQVLEHTESARVQYALVDRAVALGWAASRVKVIDADLGMSAASAQGRPGFAELVSEVGLGHVGIVLGVEVSRLARSGRDWYQLMELCALAGTLLGDSDGIYDPAQYNDRLLLGLKGTMSEAELHLIKQRMAAGRLAKAQRGELFFSVPTGYVLRPSGEVVKDADEQVQAVIALIFELFDELGTINAVLAYLVEHRIELGIRVREGPDQGELVWRRPNRMTLTNILHNPIYAGIYAYGRSGVDHRKKVPGRPFTGRVTVPIQQWRVVLPERLPAYISAQQYERNLERMAANRARSESVGAARDGRALLAGVIRCGRCGHRMIIQYHRRGDDALHNYVCVREYADRGGPRCQQLAGPCVDAHVTERLLEMIAPAALEVSLHAAEQIESDRARLEKLWRQRLERAAYATDRARRQYQLAEPENRLVVRQLERDWEQALAELESLREDHDRFLAGRPLLLSAAEREQIRALAADLPALWHADTTSNADRKQLLRTIIEAVTVTVHGESEQVTAQITWAGGHTTSGDLVRPVARLEQLSYYPCLAELVLQLDDAGLTSAQIADRLNAEGLRPPKRFATFGAQAIRDLVRRLRTTTDQPGRTWPQRRPPGRNAWWSAALARELAMPPVTLYNWIRRGWVTAHQEPGTRLWIVTADAAEIDRLRALRALPHGYHNRRRWQQQNPPHRSDEPPTTS